MKSQGTDLAILSALLLLGILVGSAQVAFMPGVPSLGRYHASDMDDLQQQLFGDSMRPQPNAAGADHPAWYMVCGIYQHLSDATGVSAMRLWNATMPLLLGLNLCLFFCLTRKIGFDRLEGLGLTAVLLSTGGTITWSVVLETHVLAPTSLLLASLILTERRVFQSLWNNPSPTILGVYGLAIALAGIVTITNSMLAILAAAPANLVRRARLRALTRRVFARLPTLGTAGLAGVGLLAFVHLAGWYLIQDPDMNQFLAVLRERHYIAYMRGSWWDSALSLSWIAPPMDAYLGTPQDTMLMLRRDGSTAPAYASGFLVFALTVGSLRFHSVQTMFIPLFAIFGVALHSIYGLGESFLFAANYAWATVLSVGILGRSLLPGWLSIGSMTIATLMIVANLHVWTQGIEWVVANDYLLPVR